MSTNEMEEMRIADDLYRQHETMLTLHMAGQATFDHELHNRMIIQLQIAWPFAYRSALASQKPDHA
jgi:hypothetical protein